MNEKNFDKESQEFEELVELLTPKYPRKCEFSFTKPRKRLIHKLWALGSMAAMLAVVVTVAVKSVTPVSASEVIRTAFAALTDAEKVKVEFVMRGTKTSSEEIYAPDTLGNTISGTLYLMRKNGNVCMRIDWHDAEKNSLIFNGSEYIHLIDKKVANKHSTRFSGKLMNLLSQNTLPQDLKDKSIQIIDGETIILESHKGNIRLRGEFQRKNKRLNKASAVVTLHDGREMIMLATKSIEPNASFPDSLFIE